MILLSPSWRAAGSSEHSQQTHQTTHSVPGSLDRLQRVLDTWKCSLCVPGITGPGSHAPEDCWREAELDPRRQCGLRQCRDWDPKCSVPVRLAWSALGLKEASLLMKATMVSSRNDVKVRLEIGKHSINPQTSDH